MATVIAEPGTATISALTTGRKAAMAASSAAESRIDQGVTGMKQILTLVGLALLLAGCVYAAPGPGYYRYGYRYGFGYPGAPASEHALPGGAFGG
jgi:hypothetical protein